MTKKSKVLRIVICLLLGLTILWTAFVSSASTDWTDADIFCYGTLVDYGADVHAETHALGGTYRIAQN